MATAMSALYLLCSLVGLVCWIWVLVKMFGHSILTGIFGLICGLYALIWGWQHKDETGLQTVMMVWLVAVLAQIICIVVILATGGHAPGVPIHP